MISTAFHTTTTAKMRFVADAVPYYLDWSSRPPEPARDRNRGLQTRGARDVTSSHTFRLFQGTELVSVILQESHTATDEAADAGEDSLTVLVAVDDQMDKNHVHCCGCTHARTRPELRSMYVTVSFHFRVCSSQTLQSEGKPSAEAFQKRRTRTSFKMSLRDKPKESCASKRTVEDVIRRIKGLTRVFRISYEMSCGRKVRSSSTLRDGRTPMRKHYGDQMHLSSVPDGSMRASQSFG